jgi:hypothetical protein
MALPTDIDLERLLGALLADPSIAVDRCVNLATDALGADAVDQLKEQALGLVSLLETEPGLTWEPLETILNSVFSRLDREDGDAILGELVSGLGLPPAHLIDVGKVMVICHVRQDVRRRKDEPGYGPAYTFFRQAFASHGPALFRAKMRREQLEGEVEQHRYSLEDLQLLRQYSRSMDGEPSTDWTQRLTDLWWRVYERPMRRVCVLLWLLGQEVRRPGQQVEPPESLGSLFMQARDFTASLGLAFPFRRDLNELRNALHQRQLVLHADGDVEFRNKTGQTLARLGFEELAETVRNDAAFTAHADQAMQHAFLLTVDERGGLDDAWRAVVALCAERGVSEADLRRRSKRRARRRRPRRSAASTATD